MKIYENCALLVSADDPSTIKSYIPKSVKVDEGMLVKWGQREVEALTALGYHDAPSPILRDYKWTGRHTPFDHQRTTAGFFAANKRAFCFSEQGTGKTASVIWAADYLLGKKRIKRVLVICPLSIMRAAWQQDLFTFAMHRKCAIAHGTASQRAKVIASEAEFVIINFDGVATVKDQIINGGFDLIVVDEANAYKSAQTTRWKILNKIMQETNARLWMLTGTPAAQSPLDAYGLAKLMGVPHCPRFFGTYQDSVMVKVSKFKWAPKPNAQDVVHKLLQPAIRFEKKDCLDLPPVVHVDREVSLTPQQEKYYKLLKKQMLLESSGDVVSAVNAATQMGKLLQLSGGSVYTDDGGVLEFDVSNRVAEVLNVIDETQNKVLVFVPFTHTIELLKTKFDEAGVSCDVINGNVPVNRRGDIVQRFQKETDPKVLLIQPQAASHGLTLTAADTIIWYAPVTSVETYLQANARIDRPGQKNNMTIVHIAGSPVEKRLYSMLRENIDHHQKIIDLYKQELDIV